MLTFSLIELIIHFNFIIKSLFYTMTRIRLQTYSQFTHFQRSPPFHTFFITIQRIL